MITLRDDDIYVMLSQEELVFLMRLLVIPGIPGIPVNIFEGIDQTTQEILMGTAERSLRAKQFLMVEDNNFIIEQTIAGILGFLARDERSIIMTHSNVVSKEFHAAVYHLRDSIKVRHHAVDGLHYFTLLKSDERVLEDIQQFLMADHDMPAHADSLQIELDDVDIVKTQMLLAQEGATLESVQAELVQKDGIHPDVAPIIVEDIVSQMLAMNTITSWKIPDQTYEDQIELGLIQTEQAWWVMYELSSDAEAGRTHYEVERIGHEAFEDMIGEMLESYLRHPANP